MADNAQAMQESEMESKMAEMQEAQILETMAAEQGSGLAQFVGIKVLVNQVWPATKARKLKRDRHGLLVGTAAHLISRWHEVIGAVVGAMETHPDNASVTENACLGLCSYFGIMFENGTVSAQEPAATIFPRVIKAVIASLGREKPAQRHNSDTCGMMVLLDMCETDNTHILGVVNAGGVGVLQSVLLRHQADQKAVSKGYRLLSTIARSYPLKLAVSSAMFECLRQNRMHCDVCLPIVLTMVHITCTPPDGMAAADAAEIREHMTSNITALRPGLCWILAAAQAHMKDSFFLLSAMLLLTNMAENAGSNEMAIFIIECLGFSVVQDGMNCFPQDYQVQLHGAKAMRALLRLGGVEAIEENVKQRALAMLRRAATCFDSVHADEIRTVAKETRHLLQLGA